MMRLTILLLLALPLAPPRVLAPVLNQADALIGTWSGHWTTADGYSGVTVRFVRNGAAVTGEMLSPVYLEFTYIAFDERTLTVVAEAERREFGYFRLDARLEHKTRLTGTLTHDDVADDVTLKRWPLRSEPGQPPTPGFGDTRAKRANSLRK